MKKIFKVTTLMLLLLATAVATIGCSGCGPSPKTNNGVLTGITIIEEPVKTAYDVDEAAANPATRGMVIHAFYDNGSKLEKANFSGPEWGFEVFEATLNGEGNYEALLDSEGNKKQSDLVTAGNKIVTVSYTENEVTMTDDFGVKVIDGSNYVGIRIKNKPQEKYEFKDLSAGLQLGGLLVEILLDSDGSGAYEDGVDEKVPVYDFEASPWKEAFDFEGFDQAKKRGTYTITVTYDKYKNDPKSNSVDAKYDIEVTADVSSIAINTLPTKDFYIIGEMLRPDLTGLKIDVTYEDLTTEIIPDPNDPNSPEITEGENWRVDNFNTGNATEKLTLDIVYRLSGQDKATTSFDVKVYHVKELELDSSLDPRDPSFEAHLLVYFVGETKLYNYLLDKPVTLTLIAAEPERDSVTGDLILDPVTQKLTFPAGASEKKHGAKLKDCIIQNAPTEANPLSQTGPVTLTAMYSTGPVPAKDAKKSFSLQVVDTYKFTSKIEKADWSEFPFATVIDDVVHYDMGLYSTLNPAGFAPPLEIGLKDLKFVKFGDYPQTIAKIGEADEVIQGKPFIYETPERKKTVGGLDMYLGDDGGYYVKVATARKWVEGSNHAFSDETPQDEWHNKVCWFRVEPLAWRVLTDNYIDFEGTPTGQALLWSLRAIDRIPYFADSNSPDCDNKNGDDQPGGGKLPRTMVIEGKDVKVGWQSYKYSTLRAFLRGEYEPEDTQTDKVLFGEQIDTGGSDTVVGNNLTKYPVYPKVLVPNFTGKGFLQTAFDDTSRSYLRKVTINADTKKEDAADGSILDEVEKLSDSVFVLSVEELMNPAEGFYFKSDEYYQNATSVKDNSQKQRRKQVTDYSLAREAKRWSDKENGVKVDFPGGEVWTRTITYGRDGVEALTGHGRIKGGQNSTKRGNNKAKSVVPAICVDPNEITALWPVAP